MNGDLPDVTKADQIDQLTRSACVVSLLLTLEIAFVWGIYRDKPVVSTDAYIGILAAAITWLFKSRDDDKAQERRTDMMPTTTTMVPPPGEGPTITETGPRPKGDTV